MQVALIMFSITAGSALCPVAGIVFCGTVIVPHTEHFFPSVRPLPVQLGANPATVTSVCPRAGTETVVLETSVSQTVQIITTS